MGNRDLILQRCQSTIKVLTVPSQKYVGTVTMTKAVKVGSATCIALLSFFLYIEITNNANS
jgi:hypothetical protein